MAFLTAVCAFGGAAHARPPSTMLNNGFFSTGPWVSKQEMAQGINAPDGLAGLDPTGAVNVKAFSNFNYTKIDPASRTGRLNLPVPPVNCALANGTKNYTVTCYAAKFVAAPQPYIGSAISVANEDTTNNQNVASSIFALQDSATSNLWGQNIVVTQGPSTAGAFGSEIDMNRAINCNVALDAVNDPNCKGTIGQWVTGMNLHNTTGGPGYLVTQLSADGTNPLWDDGYAIAGATVRDTGFFDGSASRAVVKGTGGHNTLGDCSNGIFFFGCILMHDKVMPSGIDGVTWTDTTTNTTNQPRVTADIHVQKHGMFFEADYGSYQFSSRADNQGTTDIEIGSPASPLWANMDFHTSGSANDYDARILATGGTDGVSGKGNLSFMGDTLEMSGRITKIDQLLQMASMTKATILAISSPAEGSVVNDSDDHVPVVYENGHWYPVSLGPALQ